MFNITFYQKTTKKINISLTTNTQAGDAELNPRSKNASVYPRGLCKVPVTWNCKINIWYHNSCIELCTEDYELLERSNVQYMALQQMQDHKRQHFTFRSYELETMIVYLNQYLTWMSPSNHLALYSVLSGQAVRYVSPLNIKSIMSYLQYQTRKITAKRQPQSHDNQKYKECRI